MKAPKDRKDPAARITFMEAEELKHFYSIIRHTAGTLALRTGSDLRQVQDLLGHADPRTTSIYAHVGDCVASRRHRWEYNPASAVEEKIAEN